MGVAVNFQELKKIVSIARGSELNTQILGISSNSKLIQNNYLFIAERGTVKDGHDFIESAIGNGASALLVEDYNRVPISFTGLVLTAKNTRQIAPLIAALFYGKPSEKLFCIGITGTNGKTSLTYLIEHFYISAKQPIGIIGTINHHIGNQSWPTDLTTPHPIELQSRLHDFVKAGANSLAIEVSSHALDQKRIEGIQFDVGVFTNLTRDHLDYHSSMEEYFKVKNRFFAEILEQSNKKDIFSIINKNDLWGRKINPCKRGINWSYGREDCDFSYSIDSMDFSGTKFNLKTPYGLLQISSPLIGIHNIYNIMAATAVCLAKGISTSLIEDSIQSFRGIPGRLQNVPNSRSLTVLIDYAHSPDALENVLASLLKVRIDNKKQGKIICVFGCGGDRDKGKRPLMAKVAEKYAEFVIVTSDNPRTEEPLKIINDICVGFERINGSPNLIIEPERAKAIEFAINLAKSSDVILIAGKGHEDYQIIGKEKYFFSDFETARKILL